MLKSGLQVPASASRATAFAQMAALPLLPYWMEA